MNIKNYKKALIVALALQFLFMILCFVPMLRYSTALSREHTESFADGFEDYFSTFVILHIAAMISVAYPLVKGSQDKRHRFIIPTVSSFIALVIWLLVLSQMSDYKKRYVDLGGDCGFTLGGWLLSITLISLICLLFYLSYQSKIISAQRKTEKYAEQAYAQIADPTKEPVPAGGWRCSCGKPHAAYVTTCSCGNSKSQVSQQKE